MFGLFGGSGDNYTPVGEAAGLRTATATGMGGERRVAESARGGSWFGGLFGGGSSTAYQAYPAGVPQGQGAFVGGGPGGGYYGNANGDLVYDRIVERPELRTTGTVPERFVEERVVAVPKTEYQEVIKPVMKTEIQYVDTVQYVPDIRQVYVDPPEARPPPPNWPHRPIGFWPVPMPEQFNWKCLILLIMTIVVLILTSVLIMLRFNRPVVLAREEAVVNSSLSAPFDCDAGYWNWQHGWSQNKKVYCCSHAGRGCAHHQTYISNPYDCHAGLSNFQHGWSEPKKQWCCTNQRLGCATHVYHASEAFDCNAGFSNWQQGWSIAKKGYCCAHYHKGCHEVADLYDCDAGYSNWESGWSHHKKLWCCHHHQRGCPATTLSPLGCKTPCHYNNLAATCHDRIQFAATHQFAHQGNACGQAYSKVQVECDVCRACSIQESGCQGLAVTNAHQTSAPYDCDAGYQNWKVGWSHPKKHWCCVNVHRGCTEGAAASYDCNAGLSNFHTGWAAAKKGWCCAKQGKGCEGPNPPSYPAGAGFYWKRQEMNGYWTWVRVAANVHNSGGGNYDCNAGLNNFAAGWSDPKKTWCCAHQGKGCTGNSAPAVQAAAGYMWKKVQVGGAWTWHQVPIHGGGGSSIAVGNPPHAASAGHIWRWTMENGHWGWHMVQSHGSLPYDCDAGLNNHAAGWSMPKKHWCCHNQGKGCQ